MLSNQVLSYELPRSFRNGKMQRIILDRNCYIFNYPKIKTDISSSIVHSEFKYPTEFSCIKSLSEE